MRWRFLLLVFGLTLILVGGVQEIMLWRVAQRTPAERTCAELGLDGPGPNAHLILRDVLLCESAFVYEERGGRWTVAWVPAVPKGTRLGPTGRPDPDDVRVLVKMSRAHGMADVVHASQSPTLQGMVTNTIERLGEDERALLARNYPGVDFAACQIFELDRTPAGWLRVAGCLLGGALLVFYTLWTLLAGGGRIAHGPLPDAAAERGDPPGRGATA
ncbi:MAG: hypothetical protein AB7O97_16235 [Planctomycetota bacterium]